MQVPNPARATYQSARASRRAIRAELKLYGLTADQIAAIDTTDCRLSSRCLTTVTAECGTLIVAEDPANPDGRQIELFIARIPTLSATPRPDPLLLISGGPDRRRPISI